VIRAVVLALGLAMVAVPRSAVGEHEIYYRYVVLGYVKDASGTPAVHQRVELVRDKTGFAYRDDTDRAGFFVIVARLGDESAGEPLTLRVGAATTRLTARFDPVDHETARGTRIDVAGSRFVEHPSWFASTLARFLETAPQ
jgi:hypothetical protein